MIYLLLYIQYFKIGLFAIGGGLATLPFLYKLGLTTGWFTAAELTNMLIISEVTPGPLGINMATFSGYNVAGFLGGIIATAGLVTPALICIVLIAGILDKFKENPTFEAAFKGLRPAVCGLLAIAVWQIVKISVINVDLYRQTQLLADLLPLKSIAFFIILLIATNVWKKHPFFYIAVSALAGLLIKF